MKKLHRIAGIFITTIYIWLMLSCEVSRSDFFAVPEGPEETTPLLVPEHVVATVSKDDTNQDIVVITWDDVAEGYSLYRKLGSGEWESVSGTISAPTYSDASYYQNLPDPRTPLSIQYAVRSVSDTEISELSVSSNTVTPVVIGTRASLFTSSTGIRISWESNPDADGYRVYRYMNQIDSLLSPLLIADSVPAGTGTITWNDSVSGVVNDPLSLNVYYYLVAWTRNGVEYGKTGGIYVNGAFSAEPDRYEPNESMADLAGGTSVFSPTQPPLIFVISDGYGGTTRDMDWYSVETEAGHAFSVLVTLPDNTSFETGELTFRFYHNDSWYPATTPESIFRGIAGTNEFVFTAFAPGAIGTQTVYFVISPKSGIARNVIGTYSIEIRK